ncbi:MAG: thioredoxin domain-containing protein [Anaerolineae bacterium]|nr:thioredoxin domain-containing protein [Anaerolineae bacterium]
MNNHLEGESSRYLQQHVHNPVDWYPWGDAAFEKAKREDKPIFLSIGYSACHWCHVMAHESFEDETTAALLNAHFVSIKVDREERPDLDRIYMSAVQALTGGGGWPMSVFLTPEGAPFYGGTYFPKTARYGMPAFTQVLRAITEAWNGRRNELLEGGERLTQALREQAAGAADEEGALSTATLEQAYHVLRRSFDATHGGWGSAPKFPQPMILEFLLRYHYSTGDPEALHMVTHTLESMARGGIYDQLGGGFHRYAVDANWLTPHFEKMLYDNALLVPVYLHAWQITGKPLFRAIVEETLDYVLREMTAPEGGFYSTQDADSEGEEGKFFVWTPEQVREALNGPASRALELFGITDAGNFEGRNILTFNGSDAEREAIVRVREALFEARLRRTPPGRDEKVLTSWNGLMLRAFAEAARVLEREDYLRAAIRNADFLLQTLHSPAGRLRHIWHAGEAKVSGFLEDTTQLAWGLLTLYQSTFEARYYRAAEELMEHVLTHFQAESGFYDTADDGSALIVRPKELQDNAVPSGNAVAATVLLELSRLSHAPHYAELAHASLRAVQTLLARYPVGFGQWLNALEAALASGTEIAIVGDLNTAEGRALLRLGRAGYHPHRLIAAGFGDIPPLLEDRQPQGGQTTAYVCRGGTCLPPTTDPKNLREILSTPTPVPPERKE